MKKPGNCNIFVIAKHYAGYVSLKSHLRPYFPFEPACISNRRFINETTTYCRMPWSPSTNCGVFFWKKLLDESRTP